MNKEKILLVASAIEKHTIADLGFNMRDFVADDILDLSGHACGTTACIAGWTVALEKNLSAKELLNFEMQESGDIADDATEILGLSKIDTVQLFYAFNGKEVSPAEAVRVLRNLAKTGEVDWSII